MSIYFLFVRAGFYRYFSLYVHEGLQDHNLMLSALYFKTSFVSVSGYFTVENKVSGGDSFLSSSLDCVYY